jgi:hypothetical protein
MSFGDEYVAADARRVRSVRAAHRLTRTEGLTTSPPITLRSDISLGPGTARRVEGRAQRARRRTATSCSC